MPDIRKRCWDSFGVTGLEPILVTPNSLADWVVKDHQLHEAYQYLSPVHRSDYLRPYLMFHHGGGYGDIKQQTGSWLPTVDRVNRSRWLVGAGYREIRGGTVWLQNNKIDGQAYVLSRPVPSAVAKLATDGMRAMRPLMIGNCAFYFKCGSGLARAWLTEAERRLDLLLLSLRVNPATEIRERLGDTSGYPVPWSFIMGDILGPLATINFTRLARSLPPPKFTGYM